MHRWFTASHRQGTGPRSTLRDMPDSPDLTVVVPMYNEQEVLPLFVDRMRPVAESWGVSYEVLCEERKILLHTRDPHGKPPEEGTVVFTGVEAYHFRDDTLGSIVEVASLLEQNRQGTITRQLAAWAAILGVPTAIAGIYGMNFQYMPELRWEYGYYAVLGVILAICAGLFWQFKRIGWF